MDCKPQNRPITCTDLQMIGLNMGVQEPNTLIIPFHMRNIALLRIRGQMAVFLSTSITLDNNDDVLVDFWSVFVVYN